MSEKNPIHSYTQGAWEGENYDSSLDIKEIAKRLRTHLKKELPDHKFSVRIERYSGGQSMSILLMSAPYTPIIECISEEWQKVDGQDHQERVIVHNPVKEQIAQLNHHCLNDYKAEQSYCRNNGYVLDNKAIEAMKIVVSFTSGYNYDDSDSMTDYFNTNFYMHIGIGSYDKEFVNTDPVAGNETKETLALASIEKSITKTEDLIEKAKKDLAEPCNYSI